MHGQHELAVERASELTNRDEPGSAPGRLAALERSTRRA